MEREFICILAGCFKSSKTLWKDKLVTLETTFLCISGLSVQQKLKIFFSINIAYALR